MSDHPDDFRYPGAPKVRAQTRYVHVRVRAASLNRVLKAQSASGLPAGFHVHADGTVHGAH